MLIKKLFTLCVGLFAALVLQAQSDFPLQFVDKDGNVIADGSTLYITEVEDMGFMVLMSSGLYVKNTSSDVVQCAGSFAVVSMSNGSFQSCFPLNCMQASTTGIYTTQNGAMAAGETKAMATEWLPTGEGTCVVTYELLTYKKNAATQKWIIDQHGPSVTLDFAYGTAGVGAMQNDNGRMADDHVVFDMQGRRVTTPTKGVYIVNGRKLVVR